MCSEAEDAGGLTPAKDDNEAARHFIPRTLPILDCVDYKMTKSLFYEGMLREYGVKASPRQIAHVKRKHASVVQSRHSRPLPEGVKPLEVPSEIESAIEVVLRHFRML